MVLLTADAANKRDAFQHCVYCRPRPQAAEGDSKASKGSNYAREAEPLIRAAAFLPPCASFIATESIFLKKIKSAFDFSFPVQTAWGLRWVHVEVDGEQHFSKPRQGRTVGEQKAVDRKKDGEALELGYMLVRLHHADKRSWQKVLDLAAGYARLQLAHRFIIYTKSYEQLGLQTKVEAL